uniref:Uncharacterized protein n=1 Tax=Ditylenchus dipsaci TaxID=166011 RepID=A0A915DGI0_9BILA
MGTIVIVIWLCLRGCYLFLKVSRIHLSQKTIDLYYSLINSLVLDIAVGGLLVFIPVVLIVVAFLCDWKYTSILFVSVWLIGMLYPIAVNLILLIMVRPYRLALIGLLVRVVGKEE